METLIRLLQHIPYPLLFLIGLVVRLLVGMRQFRRRGLGGLQHFNNYFTGVITLFAERLLKWTAIALMLWGLAGLLLK